QVEVILDKLLTIFVESKCSEFVVGGDCNCNVLIPSNHSRLINDKFASIGLLTCFDHSNIPSSNLFSFQVLSRNVSSLIDFFFVSHKIGKGIANFEIIKDPINL